MKNNNFEDQFRKAFSEYEPKLSTDDIWDNVEPHLKKKKKRRFFFFWWLAAGLGIVALTYGIKQEFSDSLATVVSPVMETAERKLAEKKAAIFSEEDCIENEENTIAPLVIVTQKESFKKTILRKNTPERKEGTLRKITLSDKITTNEIILNKITTKEITKKKVVSNSNSKTESEPEATKLPENKSREPEIKSEKKEKEKRKKSGKKKSKKKKKKRRIKPLRTKWKFHTQLIAGPVLPIRIITAADSDTYASLRRNSEKGLGGFMINSNFISQSPRGLVLSGGLEYIEFRERFRYETENERTMTSFGTIAVVENAEGEIVDNINGPVTTITTITQKVRHTNKYRYFSFPVGIGKAWRNRKNHWRVYGGIDFNLHFSFAGKIFADSFTDLAPISELSPSENGREYRETFRRRAGVGLWLTTEYSRPITNHLSWMIAPRIKLPLSSINTLEYGTSQRYIPLSVQVGINYLINPKKKKKRKKQRK